MTPPIIESHTIHFLSFEPAHHAELASKPLSPCWEDEKPLWFWPAAGSLVFGAAFLLTFICLLVIFMGTL